METKRNPILNSVDVILFRVKKGGEKVYNRQDTIAMLLLKNLDRVIYSTRSTRVLINNAEIFRETALAPRITKKSFTERKLKKTPIELYEGDKENN
jgi:hypothetical protein